MSLLRALTAATFTLSAALSILPAAVPRGFLERTSCSQCDLHRSRGRIVTLPLHRGTAHRATFWYIVTDSSDKADAQRRGAVSRLSRQHQAAAAALRRRGHGVRRCDRLSRCSGLRTPSARTLRARLDSRPRRQCREPPPAAIYAVLEDRFSDRQCADRRDRRRTVHVRTHADTEDRVVAIDTVKKTVTLALVKAFFDGNASFT